MFFNNKNYGVLYVSTSEKWRNLVVLQKDLEFIEMLLNEKDAVREEVIKLSREITRLAGSIVHLVHRGEWSQAGELLVKARELVRELNKLVEKHPDLKYSGLVYNCLGEYVEAYMFYSIITQHSTPSISELEVTIVPYLQGLGDLIGEIRRYVIKLLDELKIEEAEEYLEVMEYIYSELRKLDYPDALTPGLRHKVDVASRLIEDTRVLLLNTKNSIRCIEKSRR